MKTGQRLVPTVTLVSLAFLLACASPPREPRPEVIDDIELGDPEARYVATLELAAWNGEATRARLRGLLESDEPLTRNAAARALCDLGERDAAAVLVANLHRDRRTFVTMDAIHHLEAVFGTDLGYDPNLGYRHQTDKVAGWRAFLELPAEPEPTPPVIEADLEPDPDLRTLATEPPADPAEAHAMLVRAWRRLGELAPDRDPAVVARVEAGFEVLVRVRPDLGALWNNLGLVALNNGDWPTAEDAYRRALELEPGDAGLRNDVGILQEGLGRLDVAEASYRRATELSPDDDIAWANLGDVLRKSGRDEEALAAYREAERLAPEKWYYHRVWIRRIVDIRGTSD